MSACCRSPTSRTGAFGVASRHSLAHRSIFIGWCCFGISGGFVSMILPFGG